MDGSLRLRAFFATSGNWPIRRTTSWASGSDRAEKSGCASHSPALRSTEHARAWVYIT